MTTYWRYAVDHFLLLPIGGLIAIVWANTGPESYFTVARALAFPVNEIGMALFFALMAQEVVEATMPGGALHTWRKWTLPVAAAAGGVLGAAAVYLVFVNVKYELMLAAGWPAAAAVDLAFAYFIVRFVFRRHPAVSFLVVLAIAADAIGLLAIASRSAFVDVRPGGAALMTAAIALAFLLRRRKVRTFWPYLLGCGPLAWAALFLDGFHPALALMPIVPFLPHRPRSLELFEDAPHGAHDSPRHFEHVFAHPIQAVLFLFGLANAGVLLSGYGTGTWALLTAALVGKPLGILAAAALAVALGLHMPARLHWRDLAIVAMATSGVFTFGLFFATAVYPVGPLLGELKIGAILTGIGVPLAVAAAWLLGSGRFARHGQPDHRHAAHAGVHGRTHHAARRVAGAMLLAALTGTAAFAQVPMTDEDIRRTVAQRLMDEDITGVDVAVYRGVVTLRGRVATLWIKEKAIEEAQKVDDMTVVVSELIVPRGESDDLVADEVASSLRRYVFFTMFDDAEVDVHGGVVTLKGSVTMAYKADAFVDLASRVPGVQEVRNKIRTLPASHYDDQLRYGIARKIYGDPLFSRYAFQVNPPVHIIVDHGRVTLTGVVPSEVERRKAEAIARTAMPVFSVTNELRIESPD